ncbi:MAG: hypothetical protein IT222_11695 [Crocinitomix sp.]|nr:hypothetical protein [Crocinitomix sp.]
MTRQEAIAFYYEKKKSAELTKNEIRAELTEKGFTESETSSIIKAISDQELMEATETTPVLAKLVNSLLFSYFFIGFGAIVLAVCLYLIANSDTEGGFKFLPWLMMIGATMIIFKHVRLIYLRKRG